MREQAKHAQSVIYSHRDDTSSSDAFAIIPWLRTIASHKTSAIEVNQHRELLVCFLSRGPHIQIKTIFAHSVRPKIHVTKNGKLHGTRTEFIRLTHAGPIWNGLRFSPAQISNGRSSEGDAFECSDAGFIH